MFVIGMYYMFGTSIRPGSSDSKEDGIPPKKMVLVPKLRDLRWTKVDTVTPWEARDSGEVFLFQDTIWMMGGINGNKTVRENKTIDYWKAPHFNDIWYSENGKQWTQATAAAAWPPRRSMSVVFFKEKLWMFGGWSPVTGYTNDIWSSIDGTQWTQVAEHAEWPAREGQLVEIFQDKIWLIGGVNYDDRETKNDVWYSEDGMHWTEAKEIPWTPRWDHATAVFDGKLFLTGGMNLTGDIFSDVWTTEDGLHWQQVTDNPPWEARQGHALESYREKLWLIGRFNDAKNGGPNNVWYSDDGITWSKAATAPQWKGREDFFSIVFKDRIWIFGGMDTDWQWQNDIWYAEPILQYVKQPIEQ